MKKVTTDYAKSWSMGIDPDATGKQLKKLRRDYGITQEFLSELFERYGDSASRVIISMWENGKKLPSLSHMVFLSELYGCSMDELVISYRRSKETGDNDQLVPLINKLFHILTSICLCRCSSFLFYPCNEGSQDCTHRLWQYPAEGGCLKIRKETKC